METVTITLELTKLDALTILSALEDSILSYRQHAAISSGEERLYSIMKAQTLRARVNEIIDTLYPEQVAA